MNLPEPDCRIPREHLYTIGLQVLLGCLIMVNGSSIMDTARDIYNAWQISTGSNYPLEGPQLAAVIHSGPVWFYILALPLLFSSSWIVMSLWVGLLTGMKYVLAYACGKQLSDRNFGLIWACLLAFPSWSAVNYLIFSHTNLVETTFLLCIYCFIRWQKANDRKWFFVLCVAIGLGIHAHPTMYAAAVASLPVVVWSLWRKKLKWWDPIIGALLCAAPFVPYVISQHARAWPDLQSTKHYFVSQPLGINLLDFFDVLLGTLIDGPVVALRYILGLGGAVLWAAYLFLAVVVLTGLWRAVIAPLRNGSLPQAARMLLATSVITIACVALIRNFTPYYMTLVIYPPFLGLVAWGWSQGGKRMARPLGLAFAASAIIFLVGFEFATLEMGRTGHLHIAYKSLIDVSSRATDEFEDGIYYPGWGRPELANFICQQKRPVYFHGVASLILEQSFALEVRMRCDSEGVFIGGNGPGRHYLGISRWDAQQLALTTEVTLGSLAIYDVTQVLGPKQAVTIPVGDVYPPRKFLLSANRKSTQELIMGKQEILAVTNLYHFWMPYTFEVRLNGERVEPLYRNTVTEFFTCGNCAAGELQNWSVTVSAPRPELVELVTFTPRRENLQSAKPAPIAE